MADKEQREFSETAVLGFNGGGESDKIDGSPTTSIAIPEKCSVETFGYNTKDPTVVNKAVHKTEGFHGG